MLRMATRRHSLVTITAFVTAGLFASLLAQPDPYQAATAFVGVTVLPMDKEAALQNQTVIVRSQKIEWVGPAASAKIPDGATRVDGKGKFLMPALAEMHAHIPGGKAPDSMVERTLFLYVANGVTTIRGMLGDPRHLSYRSSVANGAVIGPRIYTSGPSFNGNTAKTKEAAVEAVIAQKKAGYDLLKIHPGVPRDAFDALAAKAHELKIPFAGHVPADVGLHRALEVKYRSIDHLDGYVEALAKPGTPSQFFGVNLMKEVDEAGIPALVKATRAAGVWQVPTEVLFDNLLNDETTEALAARPEMKYVLQPTDIQNWTKQRMEFQKTPPEERRRLLTIRRRLIKELHDAGVPFALGSDAPQMWNVPGFSIHRELKSMIDAGLTPYQALKTGTVNVGVYFGTNDGILAAGRRADLLLLDANPVENIANSTKIAGVMVNGRWLPKADIDKRLTTTD
jgi:imidazolonepropionase-like amidohydrolase